MWRVSSPSRTPCPLPPPAPRPPRCACAYAGDGSLTCVSRRCGGRRDTCSSRAARAAAILLPRSVADVANRVALLRGEVATSARLPLRISREGLPRVVCVGDQTWTRDPSDTAGLCNETIVAKVMMTLRPGVIIGCNGWRPMFENPLGKPVGPARWTAKLSFGRGRSQAGRTPSTTKTQRLGGSSGRVMSDHLPLRHNNYLEVPRGS